MKRLAFAIGLLVGLTVPTWAARDEPFSVEGLNSKSSKIFVDGMALGIAHMNAMWWLKGPPRLFCPTNAVTGSYLRELLSQVLAGPHEPKIIAAAAVVELEGKFPCRE